MPFYPSPSRDDGYDLVDFYGVDGRLGSLGDFTEFMRTAHDRGIKVIADLVVNHTSDQHPWFQAASTDRDSPFHDYYVWRAKKPKKGQPKPVFPGVEEDVWTYVRKVARYYLHIFYRHQPDLNAANPAVRDEIAKVIGYWLAQGLAGFRVDAVPFLIDMSTGTEGDVKIEPHQFLRDLRSFLNRREGMAALFGEVNLPPDELRDYFGDEDGDELHVILNFFVNQAFYLSLVRRDAGPLLAALDALPPIPPDAQWGHFLRNHDELNLDKLSDSEREEVFAALGPEKDMQLFGRGLRRRLPPMLKGDQRRLRMAYSLLFSLPGTPVLFYGEEIGMGENLEIEGRMSVRTPMQWSAEDNGGFSTCPPDQLRRPLPTGEYGPERVNAAAQRRDPVSLLNWMERLIRRRKECPEFGWGKSTKLADLPAALFGLRFDWNDSTLLALHNLSDEPVRAIVQLGRTRDAGWQGGAPDPGDAPWVDAEDLLGDEGPRPIEGEQLPIELDGYGSQWLRLRRTGQRIVP